MLALALALVIAAGCGGTGSAEEDEKPSEPQVSKAEQLAGLRDVDTAAVPDGPNVDQLFTIEEAREITGLTEAFIAVPAG